MQKEKKIRYVKQSEIDLKKWNNCILYSANEMVYAYSWYLDVVSYNWEALVYGDYEAVMPLTNNKKYGVSYLYQPLFTQQLGVFSNSKMDANLIKLFIAAIPKKYRYIDINLSKYNDVTYLQKVKVEPQATYELDLIESYETIEKRYTQNNKINLKTAVNNGLSIVSGLMPNELFKLMNKPVKQIHFNHDDISTLRQLIAAAIRYKSGYFYGVYDKFNTLIAAGVLVCGKNKACFILPVSTEEGIKQGSMFLLVDKFIRDFSGKNLILDFEGSNMSSVEQFYKGFGADKFTFNNIKINRLPFPFRMFK